MSSDKYYMELEAENKELKEENEGLKKKLDEGTEQHLADTKKLNNFYMKTKEENEKLKEVVDYDGFKMQILETEVNNAMDYIDEAIERYSSPNPMIHKSTMLADFAELKKLLMN